VIRRLRSLGTRAGRRLARQHGYTLIEMLVAMSAGTVVMLTLFTIIDVSLHQTTRTFSYVDATGRARTAVETLENELHSACIASGETPIQSGSSGSSLEFVSQYGNAANVTPIERLITFSAGTLTETDYSVSGGTAPNWTFNTTPMSPPRTLLDNVSLQSGTSGVFRYFAYQEPLDSSGNPYTDPNGNPYMMLIDGTSAVPGTSTIPAAQPLAVPLSVANAQLATEITIGMAVGPGGGTGENTASPGDTTINVTDSVTLRLTPPANHVGSGNTFLPCE